MAPRPQSFDGGPDIRVRGNAYQVLEKYLALAREANTAGDRIAAENYLQHAEHYYRMINASGDPNGRRQGARPDGNGSEPQARQQRGPDADAIAGERAAGGTEDDGAA